MLCVASDGHKLLPYGILSRKTIRKNEMLLKTLVCIHKNEWITANLIEDWTKNIWQRRPRALFNPGRLSKILISRTEG